MKKTTTLFGIFLSLFFFQSLYATDWEKLGNNALSSADGSYTQIALAPDGTPYVAFKEGGSNGYKISVMKYASNAWQIVGSLGFNSAPINYPSIAVDNNGVVYVAFQQEGNGYKTWAMKYNGTSWEYMGASAVSDGEASYVNIRTDASNHVYVSYRDHSLGYKACVKQWDGTAGIWNYIGTSAFSDGPADQICMAIDKNNVPFVAFKDESGGFKASIMKYNGTSWEYVGGRSASSGIVASSISLAIDGNNVPYVAYINENNSNKASLMKYNGSAWENVGGTTFSVGEVSFLSVAINQNNVPYISYRDHSMGYKAFVQKYESGAWTYLGSSTTGYSDGASDYNKIAIDKSSNKIYVALMDESQSGKCFAWYFQDTMLTSAYVPASTNNSINYYTTKNGIVFENLQKEAIYIYSGSGLLVKQIYPDSKSINIKLAKGVYIVHSQNQNFKIVI